MPIRQDLSIEAGKANLVALPIMAAILLCYLSIYYLLWGRLSLGGFFELKSFIAVLLIGIPLHELLHALGWITAGRIGWRDIKFGVVWKALAPYAHCKVAVSKSAYVFALLLPLLLMGVIPYLYALWSASAWWLWFATFYSVAASGDILVYWLIRKVDGNKLVIDHPQRVGCQVVGE